MRERERVEHPLESGKGQGQRQLVLAPRMVEWDYFEGSHTFRMHERGTHPTSNDFCIKGQKKKKHSFMFALQNPQATSGGNININFTVTWL